MEFREFAGRILDGDRLSDKLAPPTGRLTDLSPGPRLAQVPDAPARPAPLDLRTQRARAPFPSRARLHEPAEAGATLHAFANHELLALELMALALLRFPDADPRFRRELVATMRDEQRHLALYLERMEELGVDFGDRATSSFFWDVLASVDSVDGFVAGLSLTLEQANLDFAVEYAEAFAEVGDQRTAALLERVHREEIVHVSRGVSWFTRGGGDLWERWTDALPAPLTPRRARGPVFCADARRKAGLPDEVIERVRVFSHSRGRRPDLYVWNPGCEEEIAGRPRRKAGRQLDEDLETLMAVFAGEDDAVLVRRAPSRRWRTHLQEAGLSLPAFVESAEGDFGRVVPWGSSPQLAGRVPGATWDPSLEPLFRKDVSAAWSKELHGELDAASGGRLVSASALPEVTDEPLDAARELKERGFPHVVWKAPLGASGRHQLRWLDEPEPTAAMRAWVEAQGPLRVEPWLPRRLDLSLHFDATDDGVRPRGVVRFTSDRTGRFVSAHVDAPTRGLDPDLARFLAGDGKDTRWLDRVVSALARGLTPRLGDYRGPVGVDGFVGVDPGSGALFLHPLLEVNPRLTFGRLALRLRRRGGGVVRLVSAEEGRALLLDPGDSVLLTDPTHAQTLTVVWERS